MECPHPDPYRWCHVPRAVVRDLCAPPPREMCRVKCPTCRCRIVAGTVCTCCAYDVSDGPDFL